MKTLFFIAALCVLMSVVVAHKGISIGIPLPFIKIRFVNIAKLFGGHDEEGGGMHGGGMHGGFGLDFGGGGGHGHHGY